MNYPNEAPRWRRYLRFWRADVERDVDDELRFHFEMRIDDLLAQGTSVTDARVKAVAEFGDVGQTRSGLTEIGRRATHRRARSERWQELASELAYAVRSLRRSPGVALAILATLALGVGANAAMFTLLDTLFLRPPAGIVSPASVRRLWVERQYVTGVQFSQVMSYAQYRAAAEALGDRARTTLYGPPRQTKIGDGESTLQAQLSYAPASFFSMLGVHAMLGRIYSGDEDRVSHPVNVAVVSEAYWRRVLRSDSAVVGSTLNISGTKYTIIGVAANSFTGIDLDAADIWLPMGSYGRARGRGSAVPWWEDKNVNGLDIVVRPAPGANDRELEQRATAALRRPDVGWKGDSLAVTRLGSVVTANGPGRKEQETQIAVRLAGVAAIVLLIACANVTNLLLSRAVKRRKEIAVRLALGVSRGRLIRLLLSEAAVLASAAAIVSIVIAYWGGALLRKLLLPDVHWARSPIDWPVVLLALAIALVAGVLSGVVPALQAANPEFTNALKSGGTGGGATAHGEGLRSVFVVIQAALSVVLLVGALLFVRSLANVRELNLGWDSQRLITASVNFDDRARSMDPSKPARMRELADRIATLPDVENTALSSADPMGSFSFVSFFTDRDSMGSRPGWMPTVTGISSGYFAATGLRVLRGSDFSKSGGDATPEVIVNEAMAKVLWTDRDAIGQCMHIERRSSPCYRVRAVVSDSRMRSLIEESAPKFYLSFDNLPSETSSFIGPYYVIVRVAQDHRAAAVSGIRESIRREFPGGIPSIVPLSDYLEPQYRPWRLGATLFTAFGLLALVVATVGMYSTVSYSVAQRAHEFGVRIALGARVGNVLGLVVRKALRIVALGVVVGVALALAAGRLVASLLYGVDPHDPTVMIGVAAFLVLTGTVAALLPAWRASRVDPVTLLRAD